MTEIQETELKSAAYHEAAHYIVATHFGCYSHFDVYQNPTPSPELKTWFGRCWYSEPTPFRESVIAWAGPIAEKYYGEEYEAIITDGNMTEVEFLTTMLEDYDLMSDEFSETDRKSIEKDNRRFRTCKTAFNLVKRLFPQIQEEVERVIQNAAELPVAV